MKKIKISKQDLEKILSTSTPIITYNDYLNDGDKIICEESEETYLVEDCYRLGSASYEIKNYLLLGKEIVDIYPYAQYSESSYAPNIYFTKLDKVEKLIKTDMIDLKSLTYDK